MNNEIKILTFPVGLYRANCYFIIIGNKALIIDPGGDGEYLIRKIDEKQLSVEKILLTHAHFDHISASDTVRNFCKAPLCVTVPDGPAVSDIHRSYMFSLGGITSPLNVPDILFSDRETFEFSGHTVSVIYSPGHTMGSCVYQIENDVFCGDTVFADGVGRTDLYGGSSGELAKSLSMLKKLYSGKSFRFHPGHGNSFIL